MEDNGGVVERRAVHTGPVRDRHEGQRFNMSVTLAALWAAGAALGLLPALRDTTPGLDRTVALTAVVAVLAGALALDTAFHIYRDRIPRSVLLIGIGVSPIFLGVVICCIHVTVVDAAGLALFSWIPLYAFIFLPWRTAMVTTVFSSAICLVVVVVAVPTQQLPVAISAVGTSVVAGLAAGYVRELLHHQSVSDPLTGLPNRQALSGIFEREMQAALDDQHPVSVAVIDLDRFKEVNDRDGHAAGDDVLRQVAAEWRTLLGPADSLVRLGGDEFVLVLPEADVTAASSLLARLRREGGHPCSAGVAGWAGEPDLEAVLGRADAALGRAKDLGRGRVVVDGTTGRFAGYAPTRLPRRRELSMQRFVEAATEPALRASTMAMVFGALCAAGGLLGGLEIVSSPQSGMEGQQLAMAVFGALLGAGLCLAARRLGPRFPLWAVHVALLVGISTVAISTERVVAVNLSAITSFNMIFWAVLFAFAFFTWPVGLFYSVLGVGLEIAVVTDKVHQDPLEVALIFVGTAVVGGLMIARLRSDLQRRAATDALTGLPNRIALTPLLEGLVATAERQGRPLTVAVIDLDNLKEVNDARGHRAGDDVLRDAARRWKLGLRHNDLLVRYGGDEFVAVFADTHSPSARRVLHRMAEGCAHRCSIGVAEWRRGDSVDTLLARADGALYEAKQLGRNQVVTTP